MSRPKPAKIHTVINRNGTITYRVDVGKGETGKRITHGFQSKTEAEAFKKKHDEALGLNVATSVPERGCASRRDGDASAGAASIFSAPTALFDVPIRPG